MNKGNSAPSWVSTASDHGVITRDELFAWLDITASNLRGLIKAGFPGPRFGGNGAKPLPSKLTSSCRWRVGDVRAWLSGNPDAIAKAKQTAPCAEQSKPIAAFQKSLEARKLSIGQSGKPRLKHLDWSSGQ